MKDLIMDPETVTDLGSKQIEVGGNFKTAVENIYLMIENMTTSEWIGVSSNRYSESTHQYKAPMLELGDLIADHGQADKNSSAAMTDTDQDLGTGFGQRI